jgi:hypothetical protein
VKVLWSFVLLAAVSLAICTAYFFGHGLSVHEKGKWFGMAAICLVASLGLLFAIVKFDHHTPGPSRH